MKQASRPVFDACAVLALMQGEPGAERLWEVQSEALLNAVNAAEVLAKLVNRGIPVAEAKSALDALHLEATPFEPSMAAESARFVRKGISLGDRCFLAAALEHGSGWTSDHALGAIFGGQVPPLNFFR